jgi:hypothetical protein
MWQTGQDFDEQAAVLFLLRQAEGKLTIPSSFTLSLPDFAGQAKNLRLCFWPLTLRQGISPCGQYKTPCAVGGHNDSPVDVRDVDR